MVQNIIWKADCHSAYQKISSFLYGTRSFFIVFTKARHWTLFWASWIQFAPSIPISLSSSLMLSSHLRLGLTSGLLPSGFPTKNPINTSPLPQPCHMSRPPHPPWFNHPNKIRWRIQVMKFIIIQFSPRSVFLPFRSKYPPQHSFQKSSVYVPPAKWETKFRTHTAQLAKLQFCIFLIFRFFDMRRKDKRFWTEW
jgi:hypothetical protein